MDEIFWLIKILLFIIACLLVLASPIMLVMAFINNRQRHYFSLIAKKYKLEKDLGKEKIRRAMPLVKGYVGERWSYILATKSTKRELYTNNLKGYKLAATKLAIQVKHSNIKQLHISKPKKITSANVNFDNYFKVEIEPAQAFHIDEYVKKLLIDYALKVDYKHILFENDYLICYVYSEILTKKHYKELLRKFELLNELAKNIPHAV